MGLRTRHLKYKLSHWRFKLAILYRLALQNFLAILEVAVIPILLIGSLVLVGFVLWQSIGWYRAASTLSDLSEHIKSKNEIMRTLAQVLGGAFVLTGLYFTAKNVFVSRQAQVTDRFGDALEKLSEKENILRRVGGIHALESIAKDSPRDYWRVMEIFAGFIRLNTTEPSYIASQSEVTEENRKPRADIQQVLDAIGRRNRTYRIGENRRLDLTGAYLEGADLRDANLEGVNFQKANLAKAIFKGAHLKGADFSKANLEGSNFNLADLSNSNFHEANLTFAQLRNAILKNTAFAMAQMRGASFEGSMLNKVYFANAILENADFEESILDECHFYGANLNHTVFRKAKMTTPIQLTEEQLRCAVVDKETSLPRFLSRVLEDER